ncbi:MAG: hypothetical protein MUC56_16935 [Thermoanaerobaculales bacterium]|jgi:hypothetical protein|nr:hypothetical protein [Thermoanaerobaculales bacterium]
MNRRSHPPFAELAPPLPPNELRTRTLAAARAALGRAGAPDIWTRLWRSPLAQIAWAASVAAIAFGHLTLADPPAPARPALPAAAVAAAADELGEIADLPRLADDLPRFEIARWEPRAETDHHPEEAS